MTWVVLANSGGGDCFYLALGRAVNREVKDLRRIVADNITKEMWVLKRAAAQNEFLKPGVEIDPRFTAKWLEEAVSAEDPAKVLEQIPACPARNELTRALATADSLQEASILSCQTFEEYKQKILKTPGGIWADELAVNILEEALGVAIVLVVLLPGGSGIIPLRRCIRHHDEAWSPSACVFMCYSEPSFIVRGKRVRIGTHFQLVGRMQGDNQLRLLFHDPADMPPDVASMLRTAPTDSREDIVSINKSMGGTVSVTPNGIPTYLSGATKDNSLVVRVPWEHGEIVVLFVHGIGPSILPKFLDMAFGKLGHRVHVVAGRNAIEKGTDLVKTREFLMDIHRFMNDTKPTKQRDYAILNDKQTFVDWLYHDPQELEFCSCQGTDTLMCELRIKRTKLLLK